jgi:hypothetical protein
MKDKKYVIFSMTEALADTKCFWSNITGWTHLRFASIFTYEETFPASGGGVAFPIGGIWLELPEY